MKPLAAFFVYPTFKTWMVAAALPYLAAANFTSTINLGGIITGLLILFFGGILTVRSNVGKMWREELDAEKTRAARLEQERDEQRELKHAALNEVAALRLKTDQTLVLKQMAEDQRELIERLADNQRIGLEKAAELLAGTEGRLLGQIEKVTRAQADLALILDRAVGRIERLEERDGG